VVAIARLDRDPVERDAGQRFAVLVDDPAAHDADVFESQVER
jgi:hypothetical protein